MTPEPAALRFRVADIVDQGGLAVTVTVAPERLFPEDFPEAAPDGPVTAGLEFSVGSDTVLLEAALSGSWRLPCSRCLAEHAVRWESRCEETYPADVPELDVTEDLRQAALLEIPQRSLCRADCKGLCPRCGRNWNAGPCACAPAKPAPFDALKRLKEP